MIISLRYSVRVTVPPPPLANKTERGNVNEILSISFSGGGGGGYSYK